MRSFPVGAAMRRPPLRHLLPPHRSGEGDRKAMNPNGFIGLPERQTADITIRRIGMRHRKRWWGTPDDAHVLVVAFGVPYRPSATSPLRWGSMGTAPALPSPAPIGAVQGKVVERSETG